MDKKLISPLRYPGSKRYLVRYIQKALKENQLTPQLYIEPFAGGASIAINLLLGGQVKKAILMDIDPWVASFWDVLFFDTEWLVDQIRNIPITLDQWNEFKYGNPTDKRTQAITCLFLNRTSFSGILEKRVGPLGGRKQASQYPIDCRFPREKIIQKVLNISSHREKIYAVWNCSYHEGFAQIQSDQKENKLPYEDLFYYFDPPFFEKADDLYRYYFKENDHRRFRDFVLNLDSKWILSYDFTPKMKELYDDAFQNHTNGAHHNQVNAYYSIAVMPERKIVKEVVITNLSILPEPNNVKSTSS